jgi:hypothetical protein
LTWLYTIAYSSVVITQQNTNRTFLLSQGLLEAHRDEVIIRTTIDAIGDRLNWRFLRVVSATTDCFSAGYGDAKAIGVTSAMMTTAQDPATISVYPEGLPDVEDDSRHVQQHRNADRLSIAMRCPDGIGVWLEVIL